MAKFIEVHSSESGGLHLINIEHIVEVLGNVIYTDDFMPNATDFPHCPCKETYEEIKQLIYNATRGDNGGV
jgi:hypothetical protein